MAAGREGRRGVGTADAGCERLPMAITLLGSNLAGEIPRLR